MPSPSSDRLARKPLGGHLVVFTGRLSSLGRKEARDLVARLGGTTADDVTPADHAWQNESPGASQRIFRDEDCCGFWLTTPDGTIWAPGDSRLIPEHHLTRPTHDALTFDFSDSEWHFGLEGAIQMANTYPTTPLLLHHWGSVDAPDFPPFNADPASLNDKVENPHRIHVLAPGEPVDLRRLRAT